ncbi:hypothetical protein ACTG9Q_05505 [Actinokineospora sp. 24-640]
MGETSAGTTPARIDHFLPEWHFTEVHDLPIPASPATVLDAVTGLTLREAPFAFLLLSITKSKPKPEHRVVGDIDPKYLLDRTDNELVFGGMGSAGGEPPSLIGPVREVFRDFAEPGYNKICLNFRCVDGILRTETRIWCTSEEARRDFRRYWFVIRLGSGLIRLSMLRAIKRRALRTTEED